MGESDKLVKFAIELIRAHCTDDQKTFDEICREIAKYFDETGNSQLASFIRAQMNEEPVWVPQ